jgi:hypothetical protein
VESWLQSTLNNEKLVVRSSIGRLVFVENPLESLDVELVVFVHVLLRDGTRLQARCPANPLAWGGKQNRRRVLDFGQLDGLADALVERGSWNWQEW